MIKKSYEISMSRAAKTRYKLLSVFSIKSIPEIHLIYISDVQYMEKFGISYQIFMLFDK